MYLKFVIINSINYAFTYRTQNDKNMFKYGVCNSMFLFTFCYSKISLAVPFTTVKVSGALTNFCPFVLS